MGACYRCLYNRVHRGSFSREEIIADLRNAIRGFEAYRGMARTDSDLAEIAETEEFQEAICADFVDEG